MTNLQCGDVRVIDGVSFVPLMLDGQSFLFNQIRHMVAMSVTCAAAVCVQLPVSYMCVGDGISFWLRLRSGDHTEL